MTGPGNREDPDAERRANERRNDQNRSEDGSKSRAGFPPSLGTPGKPMRVHIDGASEDFFLGFSRRSTTGPDGQQHGPAHGFSGTPLADVRALAQSVKQVTDELRRGVDMAQQFSVGAVEAITRQRESTIEDNRLQREHVEQVLRSIEQSMARIQHGEGGGHGRHRADDDDHRPAGPFDNRPGRGRGRGRDDYLDLDDVAAGGSGRPPGPPGPPGGPVDMDDVPGDPEGEFGPALPPDMARARADSDTQNARAARQHTDLNARALPFLARNRSRSSLRRGIERMAAEQIHQRWGTGTGGQGTLIPQYGEDGEISHHILRRDGQDDERIENDDERMPGLQKMATKQAVVSTASAGLKAAGFMGAAKAVPVLGWALTAADLVNQGLQFVGDQNKKSSYYQAIYAGDSKYGGDALGQRVQEEAYVWGNRLSAFSGGLTEDDSRKAFKGVSEIGLKDGQRGSALKFIESSYSDLGMDVSTSLQLVQTSVKGANTSLAGLDKALKNVGTMARATSQNANVLYQSFAKNYELTLGMSLGANAPGLAASLTELTSGQTRDLAGVSYQPLASETTRRILGGIAGHPYSWLESQYAQGNTQPLTNAIDAKNKAAYGGALAGQGDVQKTIEQEIAARGGAEKVRNTPGAWRDIANKAMEAPGADPENLKRYLSAQGIEDVSSLTDQQIYERVVQHAVGGDSVTEATQKNQEQFNQSSLNPLTDGIGAETSITGGVRIGSQWVRDRTSTDPFVSAFGWGERGSRNSALEAYTQRQMGMFGPAGRDKTDPVIQSLIEKVGGQSEVGFKVQTGDGEKVVSLSDAIKYYPDQLTKGTATMVGGAGDSDGQSVKSFIGGAESNTTDADTTGSKGRPGETEDEWRKDNPSDAADAKATENGSGKVTLDMSDELKRWFSANVSGSVTDGSTEAGAASSVPPVISGGLPN